MVSTDGSGQLTYTPDEKGNVLPDFSYVGYHHGEKSIPDVPVAKTISALAGDNRSHIQSAIDQVAGFPADANGHKGAVLLNAGLYEVSCTIFMRSGVVLRGKGDTTVIKATFTSKDALIAVNEKASSGHTLDEGTRSQITDTYVPLGTHTFNVESGHSFNEGDRVVLQREPTQKWVDLTSGEYGWNAERYTIDFFRVIEEVNGNSITIDVPVVDHMYTGIATGYLLKYTPSTDYKTEIGIEDLRLVSYYADERTTDHSYCGVRIYAAENGWVRNVDFYHFTDN